MTSELDTKRNKFSSLGDRMRTQRKLLNLSQEALGVSIGLDESCSRVRISRYETGVHEPNIAIMKRIAETLGVSVAYLYCERNSVAELIALAYKLPDDQIQLITNQIFISLKNNCIVK